MLWRSVVQPAEREGGSHLRRVDLAVGGAAPALLDPRPPVASPDVARAVPSAGIEGAEPGEPQRPQIVPGLGQGTRGQRTRRGIRSGIRDISPLAIAGFAANGANVVVTLLVARLLSTRGYGALAQLTSLFLVVSMPGTAVVVGVVRRATALNTFGKGAAVAAWARRAHARTTIGVVLVGVVALFGRGILSRALGIPAPLGVFAMVLAGCVWVSLCLDRGLLQANQAYRTLGANLLIEGAARTAAVLCLVGVGLGVAGAAWGMLVAELVTALHARLAADRTWVAGVGRATLQLLKRRAPRTAKALHRDEKALGAAGGPPRSEVADSSARRAPSRIFLDMGSALVAMALLAYLQNVDVIVLGREAPHASGPYAAISVASKALVFAAIALGGYVLPEAAIEWHRGGHALRQLGVTLLLLAAPCAALLLAALAFPKGLLSFVFSARYDGAHSAFWLLVLAMAFLSATVILTTYLLAAGQRWIGGLLLVGAVLATFALSAAHGAPRQTALANLAVQGALAVATTGAFAAVHVRRASKRAIEQRAIEELATGQLATGQLATGQLATGQLATEAAWGGLAGG